MQVLPDLSNTKLRSDKLKLAGAYNGRVPRGNRRVMRLHASVSCLCLCDRSTSTLEVKHVQL